MSRFERDHRKHLDSPGDAHHDAPAPLGSNADAEDSAAHIAELVRRTAERHGAPGSASVAGPDDAQHPPIPAPTVVQPVAQLTHPATRQPSRRILVAAGTLVAVLIGGAVALSNPFGPDALPPTSPTPKTSAPAGYSVKVSDVIADCAGHARGQTKDSFQTQNCVKATRSVATGQVGGRPALFVASRIEMASAEAAASVKQVIDGNGTGNLNDLLREGKTFTGAPAQMPTSGYASVQTGKVITVAEAGFIDGGQSSGSDAALRAAAAQVATLVNAQG